MLKTISFKMESRHGLWIAVGFISFLLFGVIGIVSTTIIIYLFYRYHETLRGAPLPARTVVKTILDVTSLMLSFYLIGISVNYAGIYLVIVMASFYVTGIYKESIYQLNARTIIMIVYSALVAFSGVSTYILLTEYWADVRGWVKHLEEENIFFVLASALPIIVYRASIAFLYTSREYQNPGYQSVVVLGSVLEEPYFAEYRKLLWSTGFRVVSFVSNIKRNVGRAIDGVPVISESRLIERIDKNEDVIVIAVGNSTDREFVERISGIEAFGYEVVRLPSMRQNIINKALNVDNVTDNWSSIIGKKGVDKGRYVEYLKDFVSDKVALVTGGAGSIGSEIAYHLVHAGIKKIVVLDNSEINLYDFVERFENDNLSSAKEVTPVLVDVKSFDGLEACFETYRPDVVFHAAALKHVPIVEFNKDISFATNVLGTSNVLRLVKEYEVDSFGLISTDKAVNPKSFMGATKYMAEVLVDIASANDLEGQYSIVRFGNVMGSSGSVLPKFAQQITSGNVVTVTHPDMFRYFMSIDEAANLVILATLGLESHSGIANRYVLDMGDPIRIVDIVERMVKFAGKNVSKVLRDENDVLIEYTGVRDGEKLKEELSTEGALLPTKFDNVLRISPSVHRARSLDTLMSDLQDVSADDPSSIRKYVEEFGSLISSTRLSLSETSQRD